MNKVVEKFISSEIIKDLQLKKAPEELVNVKYPGGEEVNLGNELTPTQVKNIPSLTWESTTGTYYTVLMTDPDATSCTKPTYREKRHWLVLNVLHNDLEKGDTIHPYIGSGPPLGSGLHRYIFLVFEQSCYIDANKLSNACRMEDRSNKKTSELIEEYNLSQAKFGNYYHAQYDDYVPELHKQQALKSQSTK